MSRVERFDIGDVAHIVGEFKNAAKQLADPSAVTLVVRTPAGVETTYVVAAGQIVKDSVGVFHADIPLTASGRWNWKWVGTGVVAAVDEGAIFVDQSAF
jgi:hypothetical protein